LVSAYPEEAILKALSLALLFVYAASGARASMATIQPEIFFRKLATACEVLTGLTAICYLVLRWQFLGNPNSLGAVMGVGVLPLMLWAFITAKTVPRRRRLAVGLLVAALLLMSSFARAAIAAATVSCMVLCVGLRQYRLLVKGFVAAALLAIASAFTLEWLVRHFFDGSNHAALEPATQGRPRTQRAAGAPGAPCRRRVPARNPRTA